MATASVRRYIRKTMKQCNKQRPVKTAGYTFSKQSLRREKRRKEAQIRQASPSGLSCGLREQLAIAESESKIKGILANGIIRFTGASVKTRRQWSATAKRRLKQLGGAK